MGCVGNPLSVVGYCHHHDNHCHQLLVKYIKLIEFFYPKISEVLVSMSFDLGVDLFFCFCLTSLSNSKLRDKRKNIK